VATKPFWRPVKPFFGSAKALRNRRLLNQTDGQRTERAMISLSHKTIRQGGLTAAFAVALCVASTSSFAFSAEAQQMCTGDAFRLCSSEIPDVSRVTACMMQHRTSLSAGCRTVMDRDLAQQSGKVAAQ
jgi:hypothetical protein